jgi:hypothetical protein
MPLLYITYKVFKIVRFNEPLVLAMMVCLILEMIAKITFYIFTGKAVGTIVEEYVIVPIQIAPVTFLGIAIVINLRNWAYYNIRIGQMVYHQEVQNMSTNIDRKILKMHNNAKLYMTMLNMFIIALILAILVLDFLFVKYAIAWSKLSADEKHIAIPLKIAELVTGVVFLFLALAFAVTGFFSISKLKRYFPDFYSQNSKMLLFAVMGLSISLFIRGVLDTLRWFSLSFNLFVTRYMNVYNSCSLVLCDIVPLSF